VNQRHLPDLIAPDLTCDLCVEQMQELTLMGQSLISPGRGANDVVRGIAGALHDRKQHVHCSLDIGDRNFHAVADIALPLTARPTVVMYDGGHRDSKFASLNFERHVAEKRFHWANDVAESACFERAGWRVIRVRAPRLEATGPLDFALGTAIDPHAIDDRVVDDIAEHVLGITRADLVAA
jgi:hypothetical protein